MALSPAERAKAYRERLKIVTDAPSVVTESEPASVTTVTVQAPAVTHDVPVALLLREQRMGVYAGWSAAVWRARLGAMTGRLVDVPLSALGGIPIGGRAHYLGPVPTGGGKIAAALLDDLAERLVGGGDHPPVPAMLGHIIHGIAA